MLSFVKNAVFRIGEKMNNSDAFFETLETATFSSTHEGPKLLVLGAVHGNETCGTHAIRETIALLQNGALVLKKGSVTFVPVCNPKAYASGTRFVEKNLNRVICPHERPAVYEERLSAPLMRLIDGCEWLLDVHSFHSEGAAFVFQDTTNPKTEAFARCLGPSYVMTGWAEMYAQPKAACVMEGDTVGYAHAHGKTGAVIECGYHENPASIDIAKKAIRNALSFLGLVVIPDSFLEHQKTIYIRCTQFVVKEKPGKLAKDWKHFEPVRAGDIIGLYDDGTKEVAPHDGVILLPKKDALIGEEWVYYGTQID